MTRNTRNTTRSVNQRVGNEGRKRGLTRADAFTAYAMDRLLHRLGRSPQASEFFLKGGVLVANLVDEPHRFTRDVDVLRRHGPPEPDDLRARFESIVAVSVDDGITWGRVRAIPTDRAVDDYDGVKVFVEATVEGHTVEVRIDIGFGDAVEPDAERVELAPFLEGDPPAVVRAYRAESVVAEKVQTLVKRFPLIEHRLKDLLDVVVLAERLAFDGPTLTRSMQVTFERRETRPDGARRSDSRDERDASKELASGMAEDGEGEGGIERSRAGGGARPLRCLRPPRAPGPRAPRGARGTLAPGRAMVSIAPVVHFFDFLVHFDG